MSAADILAAGSVAVNLTLTGGLLAGRLRTATARRKPAAAPAWTITSLPAAARPPTPADVSPADAYAALQAAGGNATHAAAALGMARTTFRRRVREYQGSGP